MRGRLARAAVLSSIVGLGVPPLAWAQQLEPPPELPSPVRAGWTVTPSVSVAPVWDSNVALTSEAQGTLEDQLISVGSGLLSQYRGRRGQFLLEYRGTYDFYRQYPEFDAPDHRGRLEMRRTLSRHVAAFARNIYGLSPTTNVALPDVGLITLRRRTTSSNDFRGGLDITPEDRTLITAAYSSQWVDLEADEQVQPLLRSGYSHRGDLIVRHEVSSRLSLGGHYDFQHAIVSGGEETFDIQHAGAVMELALSPSFQLLGSAGWAWQLAGRGQEAESAPAFLAEVRYQANCTFWSFGYARTYLASFGFGGTVQNEGCARPCRCRSAGASSCRRSSPRVTTTRSRATALASVRCRPRVRRASSWHPGFASRRSPCRRGRTRGERGPDFPHTCRCAVRHALSDEAGMMQQESEARVDYFAVVRRRRWSLIVPALLGLMVGVALAMLYRASTWQPPPWPSPPRPCPVDWPRPRRPIRWSASAPSLTSS